jgi:hypothetical protein
MVFHEFFRRKPYEEGKVTKAKPPRNRYARIALAVGVLPFAASCALDPYDQDPGRMFAAGLLAATCIGFLIAGWHSNRMAGRADRLGVIVTEAVNRAARGVIAGSELEQLLHDSPSGDGADGEGRNRNAPLPPKPRSGSLAAAS